MRPPAVANTQNERLDGSPDLGLVGLRRAQKSRQEDHRKPPGPLRPEEQPEPSPFAGVGACLLASGQGLGFFAGKI